MVVVDVFRVFAFVWKIFKFMVKFGVWPCIMARCNPCVFFFWFRLPFATDITLSLERSFVAPAGGSLTESPSVRVPLRGTVCDLMDLDKKLLSSKHMNYTDAHQAMVADELDVRSVLIKVKESYRAIKD